MTRAEIPYLVPYIVFLALSLGVSYYVWRRRSVNGGVAFTWYVTARTLAIFGFILELISLDIPAKIFWDKFQWFAELISLAALPVFAVQYAEHKLQNPRRLFALSLVIPALFAFAVLTDSLHHLLYPNPLLNTDFPFPELTYDFTWVVYGFTLYGYAIIFWGAGILVRRFFRLRNLPRAQTAIVLLGFLIPIFGTVFSLLEINIAPQRDATPFTSTIGNLIIAWGLFRLRLFDIVPIARERILENMADQVIVLDAQDRIIDINQAALGVLGKRASEVIGKSNSVVFSQWVDLVERFRNVNEIATEIKTVVRGQEAYYALNISPIYGRKNQLVGRVIVAHDITRRKTLEDGYRQLSEELEQRVRERTEELRESAERYRAVVENQTEFIVRWKPDGTRTFVNDAYCRYFGITPKQALSTSFVPLIAEEDRRAVEEKISRLRSGVASVETDIHRVIKTDGSVGWHEWTDQSIQDETGNIIEFQSVGRDITERKLAEDSLRKQIAFDELMTSLLARFATCSYAEVDASIQTGLREIAEFVGAEHVDLITLSRDDSLWRGSYLWRAPGLSSVAEPTRSIPVGRLEWSENKLLKGEPIKITTLDDYPPEAAMDRQFSESEDTKSLLSVPIRGLGKVTSGCIDLISYTRHIEWSDDDVTHLKMIGDVIANLLERKRAEENLADAYDTTLEGWAKALELRDKETEGHSRRVTETTLIVARAMGFNEEELIHVRRGSLLHDIGKMGIPDDILRKNGPLTDEEREVVQKHPITAFDLLKRISHLEKALEIPYCHHEKWDGTGYPRGLKGEAIPLAARIFAVVDVWDALSSDRPYRKAWSRERVSQ